MNKVFNNILYNVTRPWAMKYLTGNLGKVVEDNQKITCYIKRSKVKKENYSYTIACFGVGENRKKIAKIYNLNKPICYVIDNLKFKDHHVYIFGYNNCEVIIKNCDFGLNLNIYVNGKCVLDNSNITTFSYLSIGADELTIKNMDREQIDVLSTESKIYFGADDKLDIIDSNIGWDNKNINVSLLAGNELNIINSKINGKEVECESKTINVDEKSSLTAADKVKLQTDNFNSINIGAPTIILNGEEILNKKQSVVLQKITEPITFKRLELINLLKKVKSQCEKISIGKVLEYQEELNVKPSSKILKK